DRVEELKQLEDRLQSKELKVVLRHPLWLDRLVGESLEITSERNLKLLYEVQAGRNNNVPDGFPGLKMVSVPKALLELKSADEKGRHRLRIGGQPAEGTASFDFAVMQKPEPNPVLPDRGELTAEVIYRGRKIKVAQKVALYRRPEIIASQPDTLGLK